MSSGIDLLGPASAVGAVSTRPADTRIFGAADTWFAPCSSQSSRDGTQFQAVFLNSLLAQIRYVLRASGIDLDNADDAMLWDAIRTLTPAPTLWHHGIDTSAGGAGLLAAVTPAISVYDAFVVYAIRAKNDAVDGGTQANFGPGLRSVVRENGRPICKGDWTKGDLVILADDGERLRLKGRCEVPGSLWHSGVAAGTASAVTASLTPPIANYEDRLPILLRLPNGVANGATVALDGLAPLPMQRSDGSPIQAIDGAPGGLLLFTLDGTSALRLVGLARGEVQRIVLNPTLWVRPDGNDANDGFTNTQAGAFRTIAAALDKGTSQFNFASSALNVRLGVPGRYDSPGAIPRGTGTINLIGDAAAQTSYTISGAGTPGGGSIQTSGSLTLSGLTIENTGSQSHTLAVTGSGSIILSNVTLGSTQTTTGSHLFTPSGDIIVTAGCVIQGNAASAFGSNGGRISVNPSTSVFIFGAPTFSVATAAAFELGKITLLGGASVGGAANGPRYRSENFAIINTSGSGANAFPGSSAGSTSNGLYL